jgi:hypothetical protein
MSDLFSWVPNIHWSPAHPCDKPPKIRINATKYWESFLKKGERERYDVMRGTFFWRVMSPHLAPSKDDGELFLKALLQGEADREAKLSGAKAKKRTREEFLYQVGINVYLNNHPLTHFSDESESFEIIDDEGIAWGASEFANHISQLIGWGDHEGLKRLSEIVKDRSQDQDEFTNYKQLKEEQSPEKVYRPPWGETAIVKRWLEFCDYVIEYQRLPSEIQLNHCWENDNKTTEHRKFLGLTCLP